jgi:PleD family two-component response regulator
MLYRYGGDEFCALLPNFSISEARATAERIRAAIDTENPGDPVKVTCSIGVASSETDGLDKPATIVKAADDAMYVSKHTTKNSVSIYPPSPLQKEAANRMKQTESADRSSPSRGALSNPNSEHS